MKKFFQKLTLNQLHALDIACIAAVSCFSPAFGMFLAAAYVICIIVTYADKSSE